MFKIKYHPNRSVVRFKARLVTQDFLQISGIDFSKTFAFIVKKKSLRIYLAICVLLRLFIYQIDIVGTYLESTFSNNKLPIFIKFSPGMH